MNNKLLFAEKKPLSVLFIVEGLGLLPTNEGNVLALENRPFLASLMADYPSFALRSSTRSLDSALQALLASDLTMAATHSWLKDDNLTNELRLMKKRGGRWHTIVWLKNDDQQTIAELQEVVTLIERKKIDQAFISLVVEPNFDWQQVATINFQPYLSAIINWDYGANKDLNWSKTKLAYEALVRGLGDSIQSLDSKNWASDKAVAINVDSHGEPKAFLQADDLVLWLGSEPAAMRQLADSLAGQYFTVFERLVDLREVVHVAKVFLGQDLTIKNLLPATTTAAWMPGLATEHQVAACWDASRLASIKKFEVPINRLAVLAENASSEEIMEAVKEFYKQECDFIIIHSSELLRWQESRDWQLIESRAAKLDNLLSILLSWVLSRDGRLYITSPFAWAESMFDARTETWRTEPSDNPVPLIIADKALSGLALGGISLADVGISVQGGTEDVLPTIAALEKWPVQDTWQGKNLLKLS